MKKTFTILIAALMLLCLITQSFTTIGQTRTEVVCKQTTFNNSNNNASVNNYTSSWTNTTSDFTVNIQYANNNSNGWTYIKFGNKNANSKGTIINDEALNYITKVEITIDAIAYKNYVNSVKLYQADSKTGTWSEVGTFTKEVGTQSLSTTPVSGKYFKVEFDCKSGASKSGYIQISSVKYYAQRYSVTYNNGGGSGTHNSENIFRGEEVTLPASNTFTPPTGCSFVRWNVTETTSGATVAVANNKFTMPNADVTVTAVWSSGPVCSIEPSDYNYGKVVVNSSNSHTFTITTASLTENLTLSLNGANGVYSLDQTSIDQEETSTEVTITFEPKSVGTYSASLIVNGSGFNNKSIATLTGECATQYTITFHQGAGTCATSAVTNFAGHEFELPAATPSALLTSKRWSFVGWTTSETSLTTTEPASILEAEDTYTIGTENDNLYAVYSMKDGTVTFNFKDIAAANSWSNASVHSSVSLDPITISGDQGSASNECPIYYTSDQTLRMYNGSSITITSTNKDITDVSSNQTQTFTVSNGQADISFSSTVKFKSITVNYGAGVTTYYATSPTYFELAFDKNGGSGSMTGDNYLTGAEVLVPASKFTSPDGKVFRSWNTKDDGTGTIYNEGDRFNIDAATTLYAQWIPTTLTSNITIAEDEVVTMSTLTIPNTYKVYVKGVLNVTTLTNQGTAANLIIEEGGQLILPGGSKADVYATFQREIEGYTNAGGKDNYYLIANPTTTPINPTTVENMIYTGENVTKYDLFYFDESEEGAEWRNYKQEETPEDFRLVNKTGYLYANDEDVTLEFAGTVPTGTSANITLKKAETGTYKGFNLVGNPMSVNITSMEINSTECSYYKLDPDDGAFIVSTDPIIVGEAFMVEAPSDGATLNLNPSSKGENCSNNDVICLEVSNNKYTDVAFLYFGNHLPLTKINHINDEAPMLYFQTESANQAVAVMNNRSEVKSVNVNFEAKTMGMYTISAKSEKDNFSYMHLYDRLTGADTDLLISDYTFIGSTTDAAGRFILRFEAVDNNYENESFAYQNGSDIIVNGEGELQIFDVMGRFVMSERINGATSINADALSKGVYILRIVGSEIKTQKIVVR